MERVQSSNSDDTEKTLCTTSVSEGNKTLLSSDFQTITSVKNSLSE